MLLFHRQSNEQMLDGSVTSSKTSRDLLSWNSSKIGGEVTVNFRREIEFRGNGKNDLILYLLGGIRRFMLLLAKCFMG